MIVVLCEVTMEGQVHQLVRWSRLVAKSLVLKPGCWGQIPILLFPGSVTLDKEVNLSVPFPDL